MSNTLFIMSAVIGVAPSPSTSAGADGSNAATTAVVIPLPLILIIASIMIFGIFVTVFSKKPQQAQKASTEKFYRKAYLVLSNFFLTSGKMQKISTRLASLSIYNPAELREEATKYFTISMSASLAIVIFAFILFKDTISIMICVIFAFVLNNVLVDKQIGKTCEKVYKELKLAISSINKEYMSLGSVSEAVAEAEIPPMLAKPFDEIHSILTSADSEMLLLKFYASSPFRCLQTLAGVCYNINNYGDERDEYGESNFVQALSMLSSEVNSEIEKMALLKSRFGIIEYLTLVPIFAISIIEHYFIKTMPGTALIYNGLIGHACKIITLLMCGVCYSIVANINNSSSVKEDDRTPWSTELLKKRKFKQFIYNLEPKNMKKRMTENKLKNGLSKKTIEHFYADKVVYAVICFVFGFMCVTASVSMAKNYYKTSTDQLSLVADDSMSKYSKEDILKLDNSYLNRDHDWSDEEFASTVKSYMPNLGDLQIQDQIARIKHKESALKTAYFHWYFMLLIIAICLIGWMIPDLQLKLRTILVRTEAEEDFLQLQTLMAILMNMNIDTLDAIWQMCQHSRIHKDMLLYCYHSYPSDPELEIDRMIYKTNILDFKRFLSKLKPTISDLSLAEAYSDLRVEREHMLRVRDISMKETIEKKRKLCGPISVFPSICLVIGEFLIPIGYLGFKEFTSALSSMGA